MHKVVAWIVESALADHAEPLTWSAAENHINVGFTDFGMRADVVAADIGNTPADRRAIREVVFMRGGVDRVVFDRRCDMESRLFESQRQTSRPRRKDLR